MKRVLVACDEYVYQSGNNFFFREFGYILIQRYLSVFEEVRLVVRVKKVTKSELGIYNILVDRKKIEIYPIFFFQGPIQFIKKIIFINKQLKNVTQGCNACIARVPSITASIVLKKATQKHLPYAVEVVANPKEIKNAETNLIYKCIWWIIHKKLIIECKYADCASYVTKYKLQEIYPSLKNNHYETYYSSIELNKKFFFNDRKTNNKNEFTICHISNSLKNYLKGHITVIKVLKRLKDLGYNNIQIKFAGDGPLKQEFLKYAKSIGVHEQIHFVGSLTNKDIRNLLIESDLMLFPTYTEGLPRVIIEAMATSLPCLSTPVGGIPELISYQYLFQPNDIQSFTKKIIEIINNNSLYNKICIDNYNKALEYESQFLAQKRNKLLRELYKKA